MARAVVLPIVDARRCYSAKGIRHVFGKLIISAGDYATEIAVGDLLLVTGEYRSVSAIATDLSLTVANAYSNNANDTAPKRLTTLTAISGSIDATASASVVGVNTKFTTEVSVGDILVLGTSTVGEGRVVASITDDTHLTCTTAFTDLANDTSPQICKARGSDGNADWDVLTGSIDPAASTTVTGVQTKFLGDGVPFDLRVPNILSSQPPLDFIARGKKGFYYKYIPKRRYQTLTGTIDAAASVTVPGVGTLFLDELKVGDHLVCLTEERIVTAIASQTSLTVNRAFSDLANDTAPKKFVGDSKIKNGRLQIRGIQTVGGAAAAGTDALSIKSGVLSNENATSVAIGLPQLLTAALPNDVVDDDIDFEAYFYAGI